jgi:two-component system phosphate regulon sensor histidine kinase PhoR
LRILVGNIIQNAIKYSHKNSTIDIYLDKNILKIKDNGIGIQSDDIKNIFDRFYRVDKSRARGGYGLGLSIVKSISELHNFNITVDSQYNEYTQFIIYLK